MSTEVELVRKETPVHFHNVSMEINGAKVVTSVGDIVYVPSQDLKLPTLPPKKMTCYTVTCESVVLCKVISTVSNKERQKRQRKLDRSSRVTSVRRGKELSRRRGLKKNDVVK